MQAFVTGSTGFVGNTLVRLLVEQGHQVKALVRTQAKAQQVLDGLAVELVEGDMLDVAGFAPALAGCDVVFHCAAYFTEYSPTRDHWANLQRINVDGTRQLLEASVEHGISKVIYVSSAGVLASGDETASPAWYSHKNLYFKSKLLAEEVVDNFLQKHELSVVFIQPSVIIGPADVGPTNTGQMITDFLAKKLPAAPQGGLSLVDVRDLAQLMLNAVDYGRSGERYLAVGGYVTMDEFIDLMVEVSGITKRSKLLPMAVLTPLGKMMEWSARLLGRDVPLSVDDARFVNHGARWTNTKAQHELHATFRPLTDTMRDAVQWFRANGYVK